MTWVLRELTDDWMLAMHLITAHADPMAIARAPAGNQAAHFDEHDGPGTIRNHPRGLLSWNDDLIEAVLEEAEREGP